MFKRKKKKTLKVTEDILKASVITSMYVLADDMEWYVLGDEEGPRNPVVMASPEEIAETVVKYLFWEPSSGSEDSSPSSSAS